MVCSKETNPQEALAGGDTYSAPVRLEPQRNQSPVVIMPISSLLSADSPRLDGASDLHVRVLAESEATLPPIIVNKSTMRVIDGMHRLRAAALRGEDQIEVQFFDGDDVDAFVLAVGMNITHGLPLSLADRTAAAARIIGSRPEWSDRAIASMTGLSGKTVGSIRRRSTETQVSTRVGRDGRGRPLNTVEGRQMASQLMTDKPDASIREIASAAGISLGTAQDVRQRLRRGESSTLSKQHDDPEQPARRRHQGQPRRDERARRHDNKVVERTTAQDRTLILQDLQGDPSFRLTDAGRVLLHLLHALNIEEKDWDRLIDNVPEHCTPMVSDAARGCADVWQEFAAKLDGR